MCLLLLRVEQHVIGAAPHADGARTGNGIIKVGRDTVVIVEYKSERKSPGTSELHTTQTRIYATALEKALGKPALGITIAYVGQDAEQ